MSSGNVTLYIPTVPTTVPPSFSHLLSAYSDIPPNQQKSHIQMIRDRAYEHHKYPCLGRFRFLDLDMSAQLVYEKVISLFRDSHQVDTDPGSDSMGSEGEIGDGPIFLDLGCCIGQDLRKLLLDCPSSVPPSPSLTSRLYGADLLPDFIDAGYALFNDGAIMPRSQFIAPADVFDTFEGNALSRLDGKVNVLHAAAFFHLFDLEQQKMVARRCLRLLRRDGVDVGVAGGSSVPNETRAGDGGTWNRTALIFGEQVGNVTAGHAARISTGGSRYRHNEESWKRMWEEIAEEEEWKEVVKEVVVESRLEEKRSQPSRTRNSLGDEEAKGMAAKLEAGSEEERKKFVGKVEEGFRWHVCWMWVTFV